MGKLENGLASACQPGSDEVDTAAFSLVELESAPVEGEGEYVCGANAVTLPRDSSSEVRGHPVEVK